MKYSFNSNSVMIPFGTTVRRTALIVLSLLFAATAIEARQLFVARTGDDANDGSKSRPWGTFDHATTSLQPGDTLYIRGGVYNEPMNLSVDGTATQRILISAYPSEQCRIANIDYSGTGVAITGSYITVHGLEVSHWSNAIELLSDGSTGKRVGFVTLDSLKVYDAPYGIGVYDGAHDLLVSSCEMYKFGWFGFDATAAGTFNSIYNVTIVNCYSHDPDFTLPNCNPDGNADGFAFGHNNERDIVLRNCRAARTGDGFDLDGHHILVIDCVAEYTTYAAGGGFKCWGDSVILFNCLSYGHFMSGIELDQHTVEGEQFYLETTRTFVINCTVADNGGPNVHIQSPFKTLYMYNTLLAGGPHKGADTLNPRGMVFEDLGDPNDKNYKRYSRPYVYNGDYNIYNCDLHWAYIIRSDNDSTSVSYGTEAEPLSAWQGASGQDAHSKFVDTTVGMFTDYNSYNYRLAKGSPAIDAGGTGYAIEPGDMDGNARDAKPDIGCYEYRSNGAVNDRGMDAGTAFGCFPTVSGSVFHVTFSLPHAEHIRIVLSDLTGKPVAMASNETMESGTHSVDIAATSLPVGTYLITLDSGNHASTRLVQVTR